MRSKRHKLNHLNKMKNSFPLRVAEHWNNLAREAMESPPLSPTWMCSCVTCSRGPFLGKGVGLDDLQSSFPTQTVWD